MKKKILYLDSLNFQNKSLKLLSSKFSIIKSDQIKDNINNIISILLPMENYYSYKFFSKFKNLRSVVTPTTGDLHLDKKYLTKKGIKIINLSKNKTLNKITSTAELTIGHILNLTRRIIYIHNIFIKNRKFEKYNYLLSNKSLSLGIVGMGRIGKHVADRANALGFKIYYYDPYQKYKNYKKEKSLIQLIKKSNILTLHIRYKKKYFEKFNKNFFRKMKKPSYFINTARGEFVNEKDLIKCLKEKSLSGAGLDLLQNEHTNKFRKNPSKNFLYKFNKNNKKLNLFVTPKQGGSNKSAWEISERTIINDLIKYEKKI